MAAPSSTSPSVDDTKLIGTPVVPVKSAEDARNYRVITLSNQLRVLLCSDPETDKASASMNVGVGYFCDPNEAMGLAHFLEHMLFLGTEKYPDENSYSAFLSKHGGMSNAYTAEEQTNYFFDVSHQYLEEVLDRFAQFFIAPLFTESATAREMQAVHNENQKNFLSDPWKMSQLVRSTASPAHPISKFGTGNLQTLRDEPAAKGINVRDLLIKFHKEYYSASIMSLAVVGRESLDVLQKWVTERFTPIVNTDRVVPSFPQQAFGDTCLGRVFSLVPVKDLKSVMYLWPLPPLRNNLPMERAKPLALLSHLLGHEGKGSILSHLKSLGWASGLTAGDQGSCSTFTMMMVSITLSSEGLKHIPEITQIIYQYIQLLQRASGTELRRHWDEVGLVQDMQFRFKSKEDPANYTSALSSAIPRWPAEDVLTGPWLMHTWDEKLTRDFMSGLTPSNMIVHIASQEFKGQTDQVEKWYETPYKSVSLSDDVIKQCRDPPPNPGLALPTPNDFIASDFSLRIKATDVKSAATVSEAKEKEPYHGRPVRIERATTDIPGVRLFHLGDRVFFKPKVNAIIRLVCPTTNISPFHSLLTALYVAHVEEILNEFAYDAEMAGLGVSLAPSLSGVILTLRGFNHKMNVLLTKVLRVMTTEFTVDDKRFARLHESLTRQLNNFDQEQPFQHAIQIQQILLEHDAIGYKDKKAVVGHLTPDDLRAHHRTFFMQAESDIFIHGNMNEEEAYGVAKLVYDTIKWRPILPSQYPALRSVKLDDGQSYLWRSSVESKADVNSCNIITYQIGEDITPNMAHADMVAQLIQEPAFNQLRTNEQLGYLVWSGLQQQRGVLLIRFIVQSGDRAADYLEARIEAFLDTYRATLTTMDDATFEEHRQSLLSQLEEKDKTLNDATNRHWAEVTRRTYDFYRTDRYMALLKTLTRDDIIRFWDQRLAMNAPLRRKLSIQIFGRQHALPSADAPAYVWPYVAASTLAPGATAPVVDDKPAAVVVEAPPAPPAATPPAPAPPLAAPPVDNSKLTVITDTVEFRRKSTLYPSFV